MGPLTLGLVGVVIGFVGSEILRAAKPDLVKRLEDSAKSFVGSFGASESSDEGPEEE